MTWALAVRPRDPTPRRFEPRRFEISGVRQRRLKLDTGTVRAETVLTFRVPIPNRASINRNWCGRTKIKFKIWRARALQAAALKTADITEAGGLQSATEIKC
jgi:hypothetical protein